MVSTQGINQEITSAADVYARTDVETKSLPREVLLSEQ
jgi:hypothetical protein